MSRSKTLFVSFSRSWASYAGLAFGTAFLNLITFGLYKPYGLTRVRRALYDNVAIGSDALSYGGNAASLSAVTFYPSLVFLALLVIPGVSQFLVPFEVAMAIGVIQMVLVVFFYHYRSFLERQYELSQISWRGQGFTLVGSASQSMWRSLGFQLAGLLTLGLTSLWRRLWLARRDYGNLYHGRIRMECRISAGPLLPYYLPGWLGSIAGLAILAVWLWQTALQPAWALYNGGTADLAMASQVDASAFGGGGMGAPDEQALAEIGTYINALFAILFAYPLWASWRLLCFAPYEAAWWRQLAGSLSLGSYRVRFEGGTTGLFLLTLVSFNLNFIMANLTRPFTSFAKTRYFCRHLLVLDESP